jgi:hypothetical protein
VLCKFLESEEHHRTVLLAQTWYKGVFVPLCVFSLPRVFYHCPTSFTTMGVNLLAGRPDEKDFFFSMPTTLSTTP